MPDENTSLLPTTASNRNAFTDIELDGTQPPTTYYSRPVIIISCLVGGYSTSIFLGENWFHSTDKKAGMKIAHLIGSLSINTALGIRFTMDAIEDMRRDGKIIGAHIRTDTLKSFKFMTLLVSQVVLGYFSSKAYADMTDTLPWAKAGIAYEIVRQSYFLAFTPMSYSGNGIFINAILDAIKQESARLARMLPKNLLIKHRETHTLSEFRQALVDATRMALEQAKRLAQKEPSNYLTQSGGSEVLRHLTIQSILKDPRIRALPQGVTISKHILTGLFTVVTGYSFLGYVNSMLSKSNSDYLYFTSVIATVATMGLSLISSQDLSNSIVNLAYDMHQGIPLMHGAPRGENRWVTTKLSITAAIIYGVAYFTAEASLNLLEPLREYLSKTYMDAIDGFTEAGTVLFNGTPAAVLLLNWLLHQQRRRHEHGDVLHYDIQRVIDALNNSDPQKAYEICEGIQAGEQNHLGNCPAIQAALTKRFGMHMNPEMIKGLMAKSDYHVKSFQESTYISTPYRARLEATSKYLLRSSIPAIAAWVIQPLVQSLCLFSNPTANRFLLNTISYLTFTIMMLIDMKIIQLPERPDSNTFLGRLAIAGTTLFAPVLGAVAQLAVDETLEAVTGIHDQDVIADAGFTVGALTASAVAMSL